MTELRVLTRTAEPRSSPGTGTGDPVDVLRSVGRAALLASSPHVAEAVATACAKDAGLRAIVLDATDGAGLAWLKRALVADHELVIVLRWVRAADIESVTFAVEVATARPMARLVMACDRTAAHMLRPHGFRIVPLRVPHAVPRSVPSLDAMTAALASVHSGGDPLTCPAGDFPAEATGLPLVASTDGTAMMWTDAWQFSEALAAAFDHNGLDHARRLTVDAVAEPAVLDAIDHWARGQLRMQATRAVLDEAAARVTAVLLLGALARACRAASGQRFSFTPGDAELAGTLSASGERLLLSLSDSEPSLLAPVADALDALDWWVSGEQARPLDPGLGVEPVSVREYAAFLADRGYQDSRWWPEGLTGLIEPMDWQQQLPYPERPVVGVNWFEANAFCHWMSAATGRAVRLQSTVERNAMAAQPYPWGDRAPGPTLLNFEQYVGHPTAPRAYPRGCGPRGHRDLAGNVWEWTREMDGKAGVIVGGSWLTPAEGVTTNNEAWCHRGNRFDDLGFRVYVE